MCIGVSETWAAGPGSLLGRGGGWEGNTAPVAPTGPHGELGLVVQLGRQPATALSLCVGPWQNCPPDQCPGRTLAFLQVDDDLETRYLRAQKAELSFSLDVPGKVGVHSTCMPSITYCLAALLICCIQHLFMLLIRPHAVVCAAVPLACMCPAPGESSSSVSTFPHCRARCVVCYTTSRMRTTERRCPWRHQQRQQPLGPSAALACEGASHRQDHPRWA